MGNFKGNVILENPNYSLLTQTWNYNLEMVEISIYKSIMHSNFEVSSRIIFLLKVSTCMTHKHCEIMVAWVGFNLFDYKTNNDKK